ncbi:MAG: nitronate monooxygenase [Clostridiales bacterium]|nr:nitronate monooxygenase [Clostridiales bacterium]
MKTRLTELLGIEHPIVLGGLYLVGRAELAAAVSEAGGLGTITSKTLGTPEALREEIRKVKSLTDKPFAVNLNLFPSSTPTPNEAFIEVMAEEGVPIAETSGRSPEDLLPLLKAAGIKVIHKVPGIRYAKTAQRLGVDAVTVVGQETGGHPGMSDVGTLVLVRRAVQELEIPVIAGGGFADGYGLAAALALGADGILMGTRFMATKEAHLHPNLQEFLKQATEQDTLVVQRSFGYPSRVGKNRFAEEILKREEKGASLEELLPLLSGKRSLKVYFEGDLEAGLFSLGQSVGLFYDIPSVKELMERILSEAEEAFRRLKTIFGGEAR